MPIRVNLDVVLARHRMTGRDLAMRIDITEANLSLLRSTKVKGVRFDTLARICAVLGCTPGDILEYEYDPADIEFSAEMNNEIQTK